MSRALHAESAKRIGGTHAQLTSAKESLGRVAAATRKQLSLAELPGYLFQGRFHSCPLDGQYLLAAVRYVLRNPVRAGMAGKPWDYPWSSARWIVGDAHEDALATPSEMLADITDWRSFLKGSSCQLAELRKHTRTGRPLGSEAFVSRIELRIGRAVRPQKRGPKRGS